MHIYVVLTASGKFLQASARLQGAEDIRADYEKTNPDQVFIIETHQLRDTD